MRKELAHFHIGESLGGNQDWFLDPLMKLGGCGAVTACDTCIWLAREFGRSGDVLGAEWLYPFDPQNLCRSDFLHFGRMMKPYLRPRAGGINRLELYIHGFSAYLRGRAESQREGVRSDKQNAGVPVSPDVSNSVESCQTNRPKRQAKAVTYGESVWVDFDGLWDTGYEEKGGLVIYRWE